MKLLDLDMDYFMDYVAYGIHDSILDRLDDVYTEAVWSESRIRNFLENNLGLSKDKKIRGCVVSGHNEALCYWKKLIGQQKLTVPFEVVHVDSHADLGLGYSSYDDILNTILAYPVDKRPFCNRENNKQGVGYEPRIGDYLLYGIAYRWISKLTYCANPEGDKDDFSRIIVKNFKKRPVGNKPTLNKIQLLYNPHMDIPENTDSLKTIKRYIKNSCKEPKVPFLIIPTIKDVKFKGDFDFAIMAQSPNYTPKSADFIIDIFKEYIIEE